MMRTLGRKSDWALAVTAVCLGSAAARGQMRITEYVYSGLGVAGEFIEFTNVGPTPINVTGWTYDDRDQLDGPRTDLSAFGTVASGQSVILCEGPEAAFISAWSLSGVTVIGSNPNNLGRNDTIHLWNASNVLVDQLDYGDQDFPGTIRTQNFSGFPCSTAVGANAIADWRLASVSPPDLQGSTTSSEGNVGRPGFYASVSCAPAPTGACCQAGACSVTTQINCAPIGLYQGDGTTCGGVSCPAPTGANVRITEYMHGGNGGEYIEFTNLGGTPVNMTGWSYYDIGRFRGQVSLSGLGTLAPGESGILTQVTISEFESEWSLSGAGVPIVGGNNVNLGADDEINLYDLSGAQVDRLSYGPLGFPNSVDADGRGGWPCSTAVGINDISNWRESLVGDGQNSHLSVSGDTGSPGEYHSVTCGPGSCCVSGACSTITKAACDTAQGLFLGDATNCTSVPCPLPSTARVRITEYMWEGTGAEFAEFTNLSTQTVDMTGWSFSDIGLPGAFDLSGFGRVAPGESIVLTSINPVLFRNDWSLEPTVKVVRIPTNELGRNDVIGLYDNSGSLVDELHYGDETFPSTINTSAFSGWPGNNAVGVDDIAGWNLSSLGDAQGSYESLNVDTGSPGRFFCKTCSEIPTVSEWGMAAMGLLMLTAGTLVMRNRHAV